jgi:hypothetical protein
MHYFNDLQFKFELCKEIKKDKNAWNIVNLLKTQNWTSNFNYCTFNTEKTQPKNKKRINTCRRLAVGREVYFVDGSIQLSAMAS